MTTHRHRRSRPAFTLIELLVVISIIALLVALLLPAFGAIRTTAKVTSTTAMYTSLDSAINLYRNEQSLGGALPPSSTDYITDPHAIADPNQITVVQMPNVKVAGAHLLLQALAGADLRGTPGFRDFDRDSQRMWANDTHAGVGGAYEIDLTTGEPKKPRFPSTDATYVDSDMIAKNARTIQELSDDGVVKAWVDQQANTPTKDLRLFVDAWQQPILYYKGRPAGRQMISSTANKKPGVYTQEDNAIITGSRDGRETMSGLDLGAGLQEPTKTYSQIGSAKAPLRLRKATRVPTAPAYDGSLARFILDPTKTNLNDPVKRNSYLLISAGPDGIYGTEDDVVNWTRGLQQQ